MIPYDHTKADEFQMISGSKIRQMLRNGEDAPEGFMDETAWNVLKTYYTK